MLKLIARHTCSPSSAASFDRSSVFKMAKKGLLWRNRLARSLEDETKRISR
jgi:hypothetical protein